MIPLSPLHSHTIVWETHCSSGPYITSDSEDQDAGSEFRVCSRYFDSLSSREGKALLPEGRQGLLADFGVNHLSQRLPTLLYAFAVTTVSSNHTLQFRALTPDASTDW